MNSIKSLLLLSLVTPSVFAAPLGYVFYGGTLGANVGQFSNHNNTVTYDNGGFTDTYYLNDHDSTRIVFGLKVGYEFIGCGLRPALALGLSAYTLPTAYTFHGNMIEAQPGTTDSASYNFNYHLRSTRFMAEAQATWLLGPFAPFINAGAGAGWNHFNRFKQGLTGGTELSVLPPFRSQTSTNFAYQAGFGVGYAFNWPDYPFPYKFDRVYFGYRYVNTGDASSGSRGGANSYSLTLGKVRANEYYVDYVHLFS